MTSKRILIGEITTVHGIKGLVKIRSYVEDESLFDTDALFIGETSAKTMRVKLKSLLKGDWLAEVDGVADRNAAELLRGTKFYIDRDSMPETDDGEFYIEDLKGMKVIDETGKEIGIIVDVENFGASDLLDIAPANSAANFYFPFTDDTIADIDTQNCIVTIRQMEII